MPSINDRITANTAKAANPQNETKYIRPMPITHPSVPVGTGPVNSLSPNGNPAPNRGVFPIENMYDFQVNQFFPDTPYFTRGSVDLNFAVRNLALQAYTKAGGTVN